MRILFSPDDNLIRKNDQIEWRVDEIILPAEINNYKLPEDINHFTIFIPTIINQDFALNYDGVELSIHLFLQLLRRNISRIKIVLLGIEDDASFMKNYAYPKILKCPGFDYILLNKYYVNAYNNEPQAINIPNALNSIEALDLKLPNSYRSNHSFVNEWCYYKWSAYMNFDYSDIEKVLANNLYFDYLSTSQNSTKIPKVSTIKLETIKELKGRILLIDDNPVWYKFFNNFFKNSGVQFDVIGNEFKNLKIDDIVECCKTKVEDFKPDVILLDFRLNEDSDFDVKNRKEISGVKVLEMLKGKYIGDSFEDKDNIGIGFGCRVIMFTATSKLDHIFALQKLGANGFIFKEQPEKYVGKNSTKDNIERMLMTFKEMLLCAPIAKKASEHFAMWLELVRNNKSYEIGNQVRLVVDVIRGLLQMDFNNTRILKLIYLETFSILESKNNTREDTNPYIKRYASSIGIESKFQAIWDNICDLRNSLAHGDSKVTFRKSILFKHETEEEINNELIGVWFLSLCDYISDFLRKDINS